MREKANQILVTSRRTKLFLCIVTGSFSLLLKSVSSLAAAYRLSYSGRLTQADGAPVTGPVDVMIKFWTDISSGNTLGSQIDYTAVPLNKHPDTFVYITILPTYQKNVDATGNSVEHAMTFRKSSERNDPNDYSKHLVQIYGTDLTLAAEKQNSVVEDASFTEANYAGAKIEYRLMQSQNRDIRIGTLYIGCNGDNASFTDFYTETGSLPVAWEAHVVDGQVQLSYDNNGTSDGYMHIDAKYFSH